MRCDGGKKLVWMAACLTAATVCVGVAPLSTAAADDGVPTFSDADCAAGDHGVIDVHNDDGSTQVAVVASCSPVVESADDDPSGDQLPQTGSSTGGLMIGSAMVLAGVAASLASRRRI